jgi:hypothetical protein
VSNSGVIGITPRWGQRPVVGRSPEMPESAAGMRIEPLVSSASPQGDMRAATAAAVPPVLPPGMRLPS